MKTKSTKNGKNQHSTDSAMRAEYDFSRGVRGKHAARYADGTNVVVIEPDVAAEFPTAQEVNEMLRAVAQLLRQRRKSMRRKSV
jgi:hypothetical protein